MRRSAWRAAALAVAVVAGVAACSGASAGSPRLCERPLAASAAQHSHRLQLAAAVRRELDASGRRLALVARSGIDLSRFGLRHSHAGVSLRESPNTPWSVRQLYYACDESRPRLFDQGLAGFLLAADDEPGAQVSMLLLPEAEAGALEAAALDRERALQWLAGRYSANAHAFSTRYQNCNQWLAELLAAAWAPLAGDATRAQAQAWLREQGYRPHRFEVQPLLYGLAGLVPLLHHDDHPEDDRAAAVFRVSMPSSIEDFVRRRLPGAERIELCQDTRRIVVRHGWQPLGADCEPAAGDRVIPLDDPVAPAGD